MKSVAVQSLFNAVDDQASRTIQDNLKSVAVQSLFNEVDDQASRTIRDNLKSVAIQSLFNAVDDQASRTIQDNLKSVAIQSLFNAVDDQASRTIQDNLNSVAIQSLLNAVDDQASRMIQDNLKKVAIQSLFNAVDDQASRTIQDNLKKVAIESLNGDDDKVNDENETPEGYNDTDGKRVTTNPIDNVFKDNIESTSNPAIQNNKEEVEVVAKGVVENAINTALAKAPPLPDREKPIDEVSGSVVAANFLTAPEEASDAAGSVTKAESQSVVPVPAEVAPGLVDVALSTNNPVPPEDVALLTNNPVPPEDVALSTTEPANQIDQEKASPAVEQVESQRSGQTQSLRPPLAEVSQTSVTSTSPYLPPPPPRAQTRGVKPELVQQNNKEQIAEALKEPNTNKNSSDSEADELKRKQDVGEFWSKFEGKKPSIETKVKTLAKVFVKKRKEGNQQPNPKLVDKTNDNIIRQDKQQYKKTTEKAAAVDNSEEAAEDNSEDAAAAADTAAKAQGKFVENEAKKIERKIEGQNQLKFSSNPRWSGSGGSRRPTRKKKSKSKRKKTRKKNIKTTS